MVSTRPCVQAKQGQQCVNYPTYLIRLLCKLSHCKPCKYFNLSITLIWLSRVARCTGFWLTYSSQFPPRHVHEAFLNLTYNVMTGLMEEEQA